MTKSNQRLGILTGGGDCPGLNAVIRAVVVKASSHNVQVIGLRQGWKGLLEALSQPLTTADVAEILHEGGTILGSSRTNPAKIDGGIAKCQEQFAKLNLTALVAIGGEDTLGFAATLAAKGMPIVGVPKTIDNDLLGTDFTFGFDTTVNITMEAMDRLRTTAKSHGRTMILEVMGRHAGWIATYTAVAGGADLVITPEFPSTLESICQTMQAKRAAGKTYGLIVVAEGAEISGLSNVTSGEKDAFGHVQLGGIGEALARALKGKLPGDIRATVLGHIQRGGSPSAADRFLATAYGLHAMQLVLDKDFGKMVVLKNNRIESADLQLAKSGLKTVPAEVYAIAQSFF